MGTITPGSMFDHLINVVKAPPLMHRLDFSAGVASPTTATIYEGGIMGLTSAGVFDSGLSVPHDENHPMPLWALQGQNDFDANSDYGNMSGGVMSGIVATGGFEVETTEFVTAVYAPNDLLTAATGASRGKVKKCTVAPYGAEAVVGCVSKALYTNADDKSVLSFWTMFLPIGVDSFNSSSSSQSESESSASTPSSTLSTQSTLSSASSTLSTQSTPSSSLSTESTQSESTQSESTQSESTNSSHSETSKSESSKSESSRHTLTSVSSASSSPSTTTTTESSSTPGP